MRLLLSLSLLPILLLCATNAQAEPKPWIFGWSPSHWENLDFEPYIEPAKEPHNSQWNNSTWRPEDWIAQRDSELDLIRDFYSADIIRGQYLDNDVPVLIVGPGFYKLGGQDKRRVADTVDHVYDITDSDIFGMFLLNDWNTKKTIGAYTQYGLQLQ